MRYSESETCVRETKALLEKKERKQEKKRAAVL